MEQLLEMPRPASLDPASPASLASLASLADGARRWHPVCRLRELEDENRRLKKMYAEERLKAEIIQEAMAKKW